MRASAEHGPDLSHRELADWIHAGMKATSRARCHRSIWLQYTAINGVSYPPARCKLRVFRRQHHDDRWEIYSPDWGNRRLTFAWDRYGELETVAHELASKIAGKRWRVVHQPSS